MVGGSMPLLSNREDALVAREVKHLIASCRCGWTAQMAETPAARVKYRVCASCWIVPVSLLSV